jgi:hypothetical protein
MKKLLIAALLLAGPASAQTVTGTGGPLVMDTGGHIAVTVKNWTHCVISFKDGQIYTHECKFDRPLYRPVIKPTTEGGLLIEFEQRPYPETDVTSETSGTMRVKP